MNQNKKKNENEKIDNSNKIEPENNSKNNSDIKEKPIHPPAKSKAGPIVRNKNLKRNQEQEEQNNKKINQEQEEQNINEKNERKNIRDEIKKKLNANNKRNFMKKKADNDDEIDENKNYINKNDNKKTKTKVNKENETESYDPNIINTLLSQMNSLSEKQLSLIDVMDNIQMETQGQIKELNKRITKLERNVEELNNELYYIKNDN